MFKSLLTRTLVLIMAFGAGASQVPAGDVGCETRVPLTGETVCDMCGDKVCVTYAEPGTVEKHCWQVECEEVCIPAIRWPWRCWGDKDRCDSGECVAGCAPTACGRVRVVHRLRKETYECDVCKYEHRIECRCTDCCPVTHDGGVRGLEPVPTTPPIAPVISPEEPAPAPPLSATSAETNDRPSFWSLFQSRTRASQ